MSTMSFGFTYNRGKKSGYDISFGNTLLSFVAAKDKQRIVREIKKNGYTEDEIKIEKRED